MIDPNVGLRDSDLEIVTTLQPQDYFTLHRMGNTSGLPNKRIEKDALKLALGIGTWEGLTGNPMGNSAFAAIINPIDDDILALKQSLHPRVRINDAVKNFLSIDSEQVLSMTKAGGSQPGYLGNDDWNTFNGKFGTLGDGAGTGELLLSASGATITQRRVQAGSNVTLGVGPNGELVINSTGGSGSGITLADARAGISETITGITYNNTNGVFSLDSGYVIPTQTQLDAKLSKLPAIAAATHPVISYNTDGLVTGGRALGLDDVPTLPTSKTANLDNILTGKLGTTLAAGHIFVGNASNMAAAVPLSGDAEITSGGALLLKSIVEPSQYFRVKVDEKGRVTDGQGSLFPENIPTLPPGKIDVVGAQDGWVLTADGGEAKWLPSTGGDGVQTDGRRIYERWNQTETGLAEGNIARQDANGNWVKAAADTQDNATGAIAIVTNVTSNYIEVTYQGIINITNIPLSGTAANTRYYLTTDSGAGAGVLTHIAPTATGAIRKEMLLKLPGNLAYFRPGENVVVGSGGGGYTFSGQASQLTLGTGAYMPVPTTAGQVPTFRNGVLGWEVPASGGTSFTPTLSLQFASGTTNLQLVGDVNIPGNSKYYGTNATGVKGYHSFPASSGIGNYIEIGTTTEGDAAITGTFSAAVVRAVNTLSIGGAGGNANISVDNLSTDRTYLLRGTSNDTEQIAFMSDLTDISGGTVFTASRSISLLNGQLTLANDLASPGNNMVYGTSGTGVRGWYPAGTGGSGPSSITTLTLDNTALATGITYDTAFGRVQGQLNAKGTYSLPVGGTAGQYINGVGQLAQLPAPATFTLRYKPSAPTSGNSYQTWAAMYAAFLTTTGYVDIVIDDPDFQTTVPNSQVWDFQSRAIFRGAGGGGVGYSLLSSVNSANMAMIRNAFIFESVRLQYLRIDSTESEAWYYFRDGGYSDVVFQQTAHVYAFNSEIKFSYNATLAPSPFRGGGLYLYAGSVLQYDDTSDSISGGTSFIVNADSSVQFRASSGPNITAGQWKAWLATKYNTPTLNLLSQASATAFAPITGMTLPEDTTQAAIKWLFDNRQTGGSFTAQQSVSLSGGVLTLVNDLANPGANKVYGTDANGLRTWRDAPAGGDLSQYAHKLEFNEFEGETVFAGDVYFSGKTLATFGLYTDKVGIDTGGSFMFELLKPQNEGGGRISESYFLFSQVQNGLYEYQWPSKSGMVALLDDVVNGGGGGLTYNKVATLNDVVGNVTPRLVDIASDSSNGNARTMYLHTGTEMLRIAFTVHALPNVTPPAPTNGIVDDGANTFTFTPATGYVATDHERRWRTGGVYTAWAACTSNVISVGNIAIDPGDLEVRVAAASGRNAGPVLVSATAFTGVAFREPFVNTTGAGADISTVGWTILFNHPTTGSGQTAGSPNTFLASATGAGSGVPVNAGYSTESTSGLLFFNLSRDAMFAFTTKFTLSRATQQPQRARFYLGNNRTTALAQIALRIGTTWYVYEQKFNNATAVAAATDFAAQAILCETVFASGANWRTLSTSTLNPGSTLVSLPASGDVTGIGVYMKDSSNTTQSLRFDCVELIMG